MSSEQLFIKRLHPDAVVPQRQTAFSAGYDLTCIETYQLQPGERYTFSTGIALAIPTDCYGRIGPRSGLAHRHGIDVLAGIVDADYREELKVILINLGSNPVTIRTGDRIAQLILERCRMLPVIECDELSQAGTHSEFATRTGGFGSTDTCAYGRC